MADMQIREIGLISPYGQPWHTPSLYPVLHKGLLEKKMAAVSSGI